MATHRYILSAGHRNTDAGGARGEIDWTYPSCVALRDAIVARGGKAIIVQEHDGDSDRTFSVGRGLQNVAVQCVALAKRYGPFDAYISSHYNGGASPGFHAIFPDARTGVDTKTNNPLDVKLCRAMRDAVKATNTVRMLSWTGDSPGVMSEKETGVGAQGYRLGEFVGTLGFRDKTARVIIEAGSIDTSERTYIQNPAWVRHVYAEAMVNALEKVFGLFPRSSTPTPTPVKPVKPETVYAKPAAAIWAEPLRTGKATSVIAPDGKRWFSVKGLLWRAKRGTPRLQYAFGTSKPVNEPIPEHAVFPLDAVGTGSDDKPHGLSPWDTRISLDDLELMTPTEQPDLARTLTGVLEESLKD